MNLRAMKMIIYVRSTKPKVKMKRIIQDLKENKEHNQLTFVIQCNLKSMNLNPSKFRKQKVAIQIKKGCLKL